MVTRLLSVCALAAFLGAQYSASLQINPLDDDDGAQEFPWPVFYLHIPKTAGGFATSVLHSACGACMPNLHSAWRIAGVFEPDECCADKFARFDGMHLPIHGLDFDALPEPRLKHVITLFRDPRQRLMSGFFHNRHNCGYLKNVDAPGCTGDDPLQPECAPLLRAPTSEKLERYAQCVGSCTYYMLTKTSNPNLNGGEYCGAEGKIAYEGIASMHKSITHNLSGPVNTVGALGFVGLADEYELTVCLWHVRFGSPCLPVEFENLRQGVNRKQSLYGEDAFTKEAEEWMTADLAIYETAKTRFHNELKHYGVTRSKCAQVCPEPAEIWAAEEENITWLMEFPESRADRYELDWPGRKAFDVD